MSFLTQYNEKMQELKEMKTERSFIGDPKVQKWIKALKSAQKNGGETHSVDLIKKARTLFKGKPELLGWAEKEVAALRESLINEVPVSVQKAAWKLARRQKLIKDLARKGISVAKRGVLK
jgi:hypothetical protein